MMRLQEWIYKLEVGEGTRLVRLLLALLCLLALGVWYDWREYKNFATQEAMDSAQLARNIAEGHGLMTDFVRPFSVYLVERHQTQSRQRTNDFSLLRAGHPDLANPPLYPLVLAGLMKVLPFDYGIATGVFFQRHQPEMLIAIFNQALYFAAILLTFRLARRLFDTSVAWMSSIIFAGSDLFWKFSVSGLSTLLLLVIFLALIWCLAVMEQASREAGRGSGWFLLMGVLVGALMGAGTLTRYAFGWLVFPVVGFLTAFFPKRRTALALVTTLVFAGLLTPWLLRNYNLSGTPFGVSAYAIVEETAQFPGDRLQRSLHPDFTDVVLEDVFRKLLVNLGGLFQNELPKLGGSWISAFFLVGLLVPFLDAGLGRLRLFLIFALAVWTAVQAFGRTALSSASPEINSENTLVLLAPLITIFGVAMYFLVLEQLELPFPQARHLITGVVVLVACAPLVLTVLPPRTYPVAYPPYYPPQIQKFARWMNPRELVMSDMPWAVAWYGDRQSIWTTLNVQDPKSRDDFYAVNDFQKPVSGLYLTHLTIDARFYSELLKGQDWAWGRFVMDSLLRTNMPAGFPLGHAPSGYLENGQLFLTDRQRWRGRTE